MSEFYFNPNGNFLFTQEDYDQSPTDSTKKVLPVRCLCCSKTFYVSKATLKTAIKNHDAHTDKPFETYRYCSVKCRRADNPRLKIVEYDCAYCGKHVKRPKWTIKPTKTGQLFCSPTCSNKWKHEHDFVREKFRADISLNPNGNFLFTQEQYEANLSPSKLHENVLPTKCLHCGKTFYISAYDVNLMYQCKRWYMNKYCTHQCAWKAKRKRDGLVKE